MSRKTKKNIAKFIFGAIIIIVIVMLVRKEASFQLNKQIGIGKVIEIGGGKNPTIYYYLYHNGKKYKAGHQLGTYHDDIYRNGKIIPNAFYKVEYDSSDPVNSKIFISEKPLDPFELIEDGTELQAILEKIEKPFKTTADLYLNYDFIEGNFNFRTRFKLDNLPCGTFEDCKETKSLKIKVAKDYPELNNLFLQSYDRQKMRNFYTTSQKNL